jgi:4-alpha-glucanotransferase
LIGSESHGPCVREALAALDVRSLVLGMHDLSVPADPGYDTGRGSLYSEAGEGLLRFFRELGFHGVQLGPQGDTPPHSASPYEGTLFSRNPLSISLARLVEPEAPWRALLAPECLAALAERRPPAADARVPYEFVYRGHRRLLRRAFDAFESRELPELRRAFEDFKRDTAGWLETDGSRLATPPASVRCCCATTAWARRRAAPIRTASPGTIPCSTRRSTAA